MKYDIIVDQYNKVWQHYPVRLTKYMNKERMDSFLGSFNGYKRADIMLKKDKRGKLMAIFIKRNNRQRRKEDKDLLEQLRGDTKIKLADYLLRRLCFKQEGVSIFKTARSIGKFL
jgi:hypothetical protein